MSSSKEKNNRQHPEKFAMSIREMKKRLIEYDKKSRSKKSYKPLRDGYNFGGFSLN